MTTELESLIGEIKRRLAHPLLCDDLDQLRELLAILEAMRAEREAVHAAA